LSQIDTITIKGYKSIRNLDSFKLGNINVLIGPNGAGKSNFVSFFHLLRDLIDKRLQLAVAKDGGADACLYMGPRETRELRAKLQFGVNGYEFALVPTVDNRLAFSEETALYSGRLVKPGDIWHDSLGSGHFEAKLRDDRDWIAAREVPHPLFEAISGSVVYHFHDTSLVSGVRRAGQINDNKVLRKDAENLAAYLYRLVTTHPEHYNRIVDAIRMAAPFFDDFKLRPIPATPDLIQLEWLQRGSDYPLLASQLSDGTLRFICLATALNQPQMPSILLFDEPELGLHPYALSLLGALIQKAAASNQIIISTQSALLLNEFAPEDIIVVERVNNESTFRRLDPTQLSEWLSEYTLGELWQKNILGGRPRLDIPGLQPA